MVEPQNPRMETGAVLTTENAYPTMLPVNSAHARAPLCESIRKWGCERRYGTHMIRRGYFALIYRYNGS